MFVPEVVIWIAFQQRRAARSLRSARSSNLAALSNRQLSLRVNTSGDQQTIELSPPHIITDSKEPFSMELSFFAVMGGFHIEVQSKDSWILTGEKILMADGVLLLATLGLLPEFSNRKIKDRSKSAHLSKALVLIQVSWILISTVARGISHLPITLLELNTLAHIGTAGLMYFFWWHKPQDVVEPEILRIDAPITAFLVSHRLRRKFTLRTEQPNQPPLTSGIICQQPRGHETPTTAALNHKSTEVGLNEVGKKTVSVQPDGTLRRRLMTELRTGQFKEFILEPSDIFLDNEFLKRASVTVREKMYERDFKILQLLSEFYARPNYSEAAAPLLHNKCLQIEIENARLKSSANNDPGFEIWLLAVFALVYGGIHAISWNWYFPSTAERMIWRISACMVAGEGILSTIITLYMVLPGLRGVLLCLYLVECCGVAEKCKAALPAPAIKISRWIWQFYTAVLVVTFIAMYIGPRVYLVVESFISLRALPVGAYDTVQWTELPLHWG
jgi:hypothetical protein